VGAASVAFPVTTPAEGDDVVEGCFAVVAGEAGVEVAGQVVFAAAVGAGAVACDAGVGEVFPGGLVAAGFDALRIPACVVVGFAAGGFGAFVRLAFADHRAAGADAGEGHSLHPVAARDQLVHLCLVDEAAEDLVGCRRDPERRCVAAGAAAEVNELGVGLVVLFGVLLAAPNRGRSSRFSFRPFASPPVTR
jgi:hypothetical protein